MRLKSFAAGIAVGAAAMAVIAASVSVYAANSKVEVWVTDSFKINFDGKDKTLPDDYHILNYQDRIYLPFRYVAEELGAKVSFFADTNRILVESPEPKVVEKIVEVTPEKEPEATYLELPVRLRKQDVTIDIYEIKRETDFAYVSFDMTNDSAKDVQLDFRNARFDVDGVEIYAEEQYEVDWLNVVPAYSALEEKTLVFPGLPRRRDQVKLILPVLMEEYIADTKSYDMVSRDFEFYIDTTEKID
ncbi:MAG: copper amine oxidase N-terminal domain-containing protein [Clostridiales bacterium]|jgi:hypothetical protein|nr:copper amine oxidase N-terminal domain-containing protein [Clostridiales bacterium]